MMSGLLKNFEFLAPAYFMENSPKLFPFDSFEGILWTMTTYLRPRRFPFEARFVIGGVDEMRGNFAIAAPSL